MSQPAPLNPLTLPLHGSRLIEASAGTGKTFTIALLYVRLVLGGQHGEDDTALIPFDWLADAKLVLTDALMKRGAAIRAARGEPEDDGLPEGSADQDTTTTPSEDNA